MHLKIVITCFAVFNQVLQFRIAKLEKMRKNRLQVLNHMFLYTILKALLSPFQKTLDFDNRLKNIWIINNFV